MRPASRTLALASGWQLACTPAGTVLTPAELAAPLRWHDAAVPGTVAGVLHRDLDVPGRYDADDWWYRTTFSLRGQTPKVFGDAARGQAPDAAAEASLRGQTPKVLGGPSSKARMKPSVSDPEGT